MSPAGEDEPLTRARRHLQQAALEGLEAALALLQAALQSSGLREIADDKLAAALQTGLEDLIRMLRSNAPIGLPRELAEPLMRALDVEIARWEARSEIDANARPVLRTFLGLRELIWELGLRPEDAPEQPSPQPEHAAPAPQTPQTRPKREAPRVQRFDVEH